jgi:selenoprotein W-related protein
LAAELKQEFGTEVALIKGKDGVFEVTIDGDLVFSKRSLGRFPDPDEVAQIMRRR